MADRATDFDRVKALVAQGLSDYAIARICRMPRTTVFRWRHRTDPPLQTRRGVQRPWYLPDAASYCYLLGIYLGDGNITHRSPNTWTLRIACDRRYENIIEEILAAMTMTFPGGRPARRPASRGASDVLSLTHPSIGPAFPQHDRGPKHQRAIALESWQQQLTRAYPEQLIRGLVHSDGCRTENRFKTRLPSGRLAEYYYVRYFFSNLSSDIRQIFAEHCELLGIHVTQSNHRNLSVAHRDSVAILDRFVGPKS